MFAEVFKETMHRLNYIRCDVWRECEQRQNNKADALLLMSSFCLFSCRISMWFLFGSTLIEVYEVYGVWLKWIRCVNTELSKGQVEPQKKCWSLIKRIGWLKQKLWAFLCHNNCAFRWHYCMHFRVNMKEQYVYSSIRDLLNADFAG